MGLQAVAGVARLFSRRLLALQLNAGSRFPPADPVRTRCGGAELGLTGTPRGGAGKQSPEKRTAAGAYPGRPPHYSCRREGPPVLTVHSPASGSFTCSEKTHTEARQLPSNRGSAGGHRNGPPRPHLHGSCQTEEGGYEEVAEPPQPTRHSLYRLGRSPGHGEGPQDQGGVSRSTPAVSGDSASAVGRRDSNGGAGMGSGGLFTGVLERIEKFFFSKSSQNVQLQQACSGGYRDTSGLLPSTGGITERSQSAHKQVTPQRAPVASKSRYVLGSVKRSVTSTLQGCWCTSNFRSYPGSPVRKDVEDLHLDPADSSRDGHESKECGL